MILNHIWGLYAHPREEWQTIEKRHESLSYSLAHILIVALIPSICGYYAAAHIGWSIGANDPIRLTESSAMIMSVGMYFALVLGVFALAYLIHWMARKKVIKLILTLFRQRLSLLVVKSTKASQKKNCWRCQKSLWLTKNQLTML